MKVPFVDLKKQYHSIKIEVDTVIKNVIDNVSFIGGDYVRDFEKKYSKLYGVKHCISCGNGTDAIYIVLKTLGVGDGDEVITVSNSWISTSETITQTGAKPVFVDIEPDRYTIDVKKIEEKITEKTRAIIPVHLFGQSAKMDSIIEICQKYGIFLVEDCAQAHFAEWRGQKVGTFGIASTFSFFPGKNLGAYGDAGGIITNDDEFADKARMFANHGSLIKHQHKIEGINSRMDAIQAAILSIKLNYISNWNDRRLRNAELYNTLLKDEGQIKIPFIDNSSKHVFHLYVIRVKNRNQLMDFLYKSGISTGIHYPVALPFLDAYRYLGHRPKDFPVAYKFMDEIVSLPMFPELSEEQIIFVVEKIKQFVHK